LDRVDSPLCQCFSPLAAKLANVENLKEFIIKPPQKNKMHHLDFIFKPLISV
jgi:hypothetical protein